MESYLQEMKQLLQQYFLLLNGKRPMTGNLDVGNHDITLGSTTDQRQIIFNYRVGIKTGYLAQLQCWNFPEGKYADFVSNLCRANTFMATDGAMILRPITGYSIALKSYTGDELCAYLADSTKAFYVPRAGHISLLDDFFLKIGKDSDATLPDAGADYRGKVIRVEGGAGEADHAYLCQKLADESYEWTQIT